MVKKKFDILSDEELVKIIIINNDNNLFAVLYDRYASVVYNKCYGFSNGKEEAQDLTHDIFVQLFIKLRSFQAKSKFSTWLYSFVYNHCVNYVQRNSAKKIERAVVDGVDVKDDDACDEIGDSHLFSLKSEKLARAMGIIEPSDKMILLMKYQDDLSIKEIQEVLDIGVSAVKMRLKRAKQKVVDAYNRL